MAYVVSPRPFLLFLPFLLIITVTEEIVISPHTSPMELYYQQRVDHFAHGTKLSRTIFRQRYFLDRTYWGGHEARRPIFVLLGGKSSIDDLPSQIGGVLTQSAMHFRGLLVYIEHRFYGKSVPYGSIDLAMEDAEVRGCLTSAQALADFAILILDLKANLSATNSPVIVFGGSYAGILATWFRLKYPHVAIGALASSAPLLYFDNIPPKDGFYSIVSRDFKEANEDCYTRIKQSWKMIDDMVMQPNGLKNLRNVFNTCSDLSSGDGLKTLLLQNYVFAAQYNGPSYNWIDLVCDPIVANSDNSILEGIARGIAAVNPDAPCLPITRMPSDQPIPFELGTDSLRAWKWQQCTEPMMPLGVGNETMFPHILLHPENYTITCQLEYGVTPQPLWVSAYYGNYHVKTSLLRSASNIIFSNGLRDPYSGAGILEDISETIVAITTKQGSHCLDLTDETADDPKWLVRQRKEEIAIISKWIDQSRQTTNYVRSGSPSKTIRPLNFLRIFKQFTFQIFVYLALV